MLSIYINEVLILLSGTNIDSCVIIKTLLIFAYACINESARQQLLLQQQKIRMFLIMTSGHAGGKKNPALFLLFANHFNLPLAFSFSVWLWRHCQHILLIFSQATYISENIFRLYGSVRQVTSSLSGWREGEREKETEKKRNLYLILVWGGIIVLFLCPPPFFFPEPTLTAVSLSSFSIVNKVFLGL